MKEYIRASVSDAELQEAIDLINQYLWREIDEDKEITLSSNLSDIGIMFTTAEETDDFYKELQVSVDLLNPSIKYYVDDTLVGTETFKDLRDLIDNELSEEYSFDDYYNACMEYGRRAGLLE